MLSGDGKTKMIMESSSLVTLNYLLAKVFYTSTIYHIHTGDLGMKTSEARRQNLCLKKSSLYRNEMLKNPCMSPDALSCQCFVQLCLCINVCFCVFNVHLEKVK